MNQTSEIPSIEFTKRPLPDLHAVYDKETIETVPYVTIWEGSKHEDECDFENLDTEFITPSEIDDIRDDLIVFQTNGKNYRDDPKSRLTKVIDQNGRLKFTFQKVKYSDYIVTNMSMEIVPPGSTRSLRETLEPGPNLSKLEDSKCSNHLGVSCLVITDDNKLILQKASSKKVTGAGKITSSASGAMDWKMPNVNPFELIQAELFEELGLSHEETSDIRGIAIARELARGGKPEMFFILNTDLTSNDILARVATDPDKEVEKLFAVDLPQDTEERKAKLSEIWENENTAESTKAAMYYFSRVIK